MKTLSLFLSLAVAVASTHVGVAAAPKSEPRPNVIFIVADDLGYGELGCYGGKGIPTPHLDADPWPEVDIDDLPESRYDESNHPVPRQPWRRGDTDGCHDPLTAPSRTISR